MGLSPEQIERRREGITATDVAAIVGQHPFKRPIDVWLEKTGRARPFIGNHTTKWGELLEPLLRDEYEDRHAVRVEVPGTLAHPRRRWQMATPDGLAYAYGGRRPRNGLEIKVHGSDAVYFGGLVYGAPGTDEVPAHELIQCAWNMDVTGLERWDLVAMLGASPQEYVITRDEELLEMLREASERFLVDHLRADIQPDPDGSESWDRWLRDKWKTSDRDNLVAIDTEPELREKVEQLREAREAIAAAEERKERITQELKDVIGERGGLTWRDFGRAKPSSIYWRHSKSSTDVDWEAATSDTRTRAALAVDGSMVAWLEQLLIRCATPKPNEDGGTDAPSMVPQQALDRLRVMHDALVKISRGEDVAAHTTTRPGSRPFNVPKHWSQTNKGKER